MLPPQKKIELLAKAYEGQMLGIWEHLQLI